MKYTEFGTENKTTLFLLHGVDTTWQLSFSKLIKVAEHKYHIIAVAEDGFTILEYPDFRHELPKRIAAGALTDVELFALKCMFIRISSARKRFVRAATAVILTLSDMTPTQATVGGAVIASDTEIKQ